MHTTSLTFASRVARFYLLHGTALTSSPLQAVDRVRVTVQMRRLAASSQQQQKPAPLPQALPQIPAQPSPPASVQSSPQNGGSTLGPYAPMSQHMGSLARAVARLSNGAEGEEKGTPKAGREVVRSRSIR